MTQKSLKSHRRTYWHLSLVLEKFLLWALISHSKLNSVMGNTWQMLQASLLLCDYLVK